MSNDQPPYVRALWQCVEEGLDNFRFEYNGLEIHVFDVECIDVTWEILKEMGYSEDPFPSGIQIPTDDEYIAIYQGHDDMIHHCFLDHDELVVWEKEAAEEDEETEQ